MKSDGQSTDFEKEMDFHFRLVGAWVGSSSLVFCLLRYLVFHLMWFGLLVTLTLVLPSFRVFLLFSWIAE